MPIVPTQEVKTINVSQLRTNDYIRKYHLSTNTVGGAGHPKSIISYAIFPNDFLIKYIHLKTTSANNYNPTSYFALYVNGNLVYYFDSGTLNTNIDIDFTDLFDSELLRKGEDSQIVFVNYVEWDGAMSAYTASLEVRGFYK